MNEELYKLLSNIISLNPTGTLDYQGTYTLQGNNQILSNPMEASQNNLQKTMNNEIICGNMETFKNLNESDFRNDFENDFENEFENEFENKNEHEIFKKKNILYKKYIFLSCVFIILFLIFYLI